MSKVDTSKNKIRSKLEAIKRINDDPKSLATNVYDGYKDDLPSIDGMVKKNISSFASKLKSKNQNKKDIFGELITTAEGFLGTTKEDPINPQKKPLVKSKIKTFAMNSAHKTLLSSKQIIMDQSKNVLFGGNGICGGNVVLGTTSVSISPSEFDFLSMLKVDPNSMSGKVMYEDTSSPIIGENPFNRNLYKSFDTPGGSFTKKDGSILFNYNWNSSTQMYDITGLNGLLKIGDFFNDYYSSIEYPSTDHALKTAMLMTTFGDGSEPNAFNVGMINLDRLLKKLFSICGSPTSTGSPLKNNTKEQFNEDESEIEDYFDFNDIEGIDLDDEDSRKRRVMKFRDCGNFEVPINSNHMEDFVYLLGKKPIDENIDNTLNKSASEAYEQSGSGVNFDGFQLSLFNSFILQIPKAIVASILSPKMFFPIVVTYKILKNENLSVLEIMKRLSKLFFNIIKDVFWTFIKNFWGFIKKELVSFIKEIAATILKNKLKRFKSIILSLISLLTKILSTNIGSCEEIFNLILSTINSAINAPIKIPVPGLLLSLSDGLPGYSTDRAYMNVVERLDSMGINTGPIYGSPNKFVQSIKGMIDGNSEEIDTNSFIKIALKPSIIPAGPGGAVISPLVVGVGKMF
jgi:hypothetical protein